MNRLPRTAPWLLVIAVFLAVTPAQAYIDGGTASMLFQLAVAGILGVAFALKAFWHRIKALFTSSGKKRRSVDE